ncbi:hypothetical protein A4X13_0g1428 [Tilletia indica]|uniref:Symplekin/Pta1 N-terminal domain-containing protein n=1 Tax=Tilletia indica TaxID=43049 RepID=A0A177TLB8_9BASI|nr:hypothetical protein A4X13_0g1428 [Tilletia indica]
MAGHGDMSSNGLNPPPGAPAPHDSLSLFRTALAPPDAATEKYCFDALYAHFYTQPHNLAGFMQPLMSVFAQASDPYKIWIARILDLAFNRPGLSVDMRMMVATHVPDAILFFLHAPLSKWAQQAKVAATAFASVYALLVRQLLTAPPAVSTNSPLTRSLPAIKMRLRQLFDTAETPVGVKVAIIKALQRVVQVQTRLSSDPRAGSSAPAASPLETSLSEISPSHPNPTLNVRALEAESNAILTQLITAQYTSADPDLLMALINALGILAKVRQPLVKIVIESMLSWTPAALNGAEKPATQIRNVEKTMRLLLFHFLRSPMPTITPYHSRLADALTSQKARMEQAARAYASYREAEARRKRDALAAEMERADGSGSAQSGPGPSKRVKMEAGTAAVVAGTSASAGGQSAPPAPAPLTEEAITAARQFQRAAADWCSSQTRNGVQNMLASFDVKALQLNLVIDCVLANLGAVNVTELESAISHIRNHLSHAEAEEARNRRAAPVATDVGPIDPLKVDLEADEALEKLSPIEAGLLESDNADGTRNGKRRLESSSNAVAIASGSVLAHGELAALEGFTLPSPDRLAGPEGKRMLADAVQRICEIGASVGTLDSVGALLSNGQPAGVARADGGDAVGTTDAGSGGTMLGGLQDLWTMLVTRLATRGFSKWSMAVVGSDGEASSTDEGPSAAPEQNGDAPAAKVEGEAVPAEDSSMASKSSSAVVNGGSGSGKQVALNTSAAPERTLDSHANTVRHMILQLIKADFAGRVPFAVRWLTEEWAVEWRHHKFSRKEGTADGERSLIDATPIYDHWLLALLDEVIPTVGDKDKSLSRLLSDLPSLPNAAISRIAPLCHDRSRMIVGFTVLRDITAHRPPARPEALRILLELTRHTDDPVRKAAINTCRAWVKAATASNEGGTGGESVGGVNHKKEIEARVIERGRESLEVLLRVVEPKAEEDVKMEGLEKEGESSPEGAEKQSGEEEHDKVVNGTSEERPGLEAEVKTEADVQRFVELPFALCTKVPSMLSLVFETHPRSAPFVQRAIEKHIYKLIKALGPSNARLLELLRHHQDGAESLALVVFRALTETGRPSALISIVKELANEREVNPRFLVPIMPDFDKADILRFLPRVVTLLNSGEAEDHQLVTNVFHSIVVQPPATFGHVSTNLPRVRQTELLTPVELMSLLHHLPIEWGLKCAIDAIKICFGMTDVFRSEVLGAVLNQIADEPQVPLLFMRTAIMAVSTYRSLTGYVGTNVLSGLITKKIWQTPVLWQGFIKCAQHTAPQSYGALIQLPLEQLKDVAQKSPPLKQGLKEYLLQRGGGGGARGGARMKAFAEALGIDLEAESMGATSGGMHAESSPHLGSEGADTPMR